MRWIHQQQGPLGGECGSDSEEPRGDPSGNLKYEKYNNSMQGRQETNLIGILTAHGVTF